jgi:hypothetical protein
MKIPITLKVNQLQGDLAPFHQQSLILSPLEDLLFQVELEANPKYFADKEVARFWEAGSIESLVGGNPPELDLSKVKPILTLQGVQEIRRIIFEHFTENFSENKYPEETDWDENKDYSTEW